MMPVVQVISRCPMFCSFSTRFIKQSIWLTDDTPEHVCWVLKLILNVGKKCQKVCFCICNTFSVSLKFCPTYTWALQELIWPVFMVNKKCEKTWGWKTPWGLRKMFTISENHTTAIPFKNSPQGHTWNGIHPLATEEYSHLGIGHKPCATSNTFHFCTAHKKGFPHITSLLSVNLHWQYEITLTCAHTHIHTSSKYRALTHSWMCIHSPPVLLTCLLYQNWYKSLLKSALCFLPLISWQL